MSNANLCLHRGARRVELADLEAVPTPEATRTWTPVPHATVANRVLQFLGDAGYNVAKAEYGLSRDGGQMFGAFDLHSELSPGTTLAIGVRSSIDKTLPLGFTAGSRVFVCDNLAFSGNLDVYRKHTRFGIDRFDEAVAFAVKRLGSFRESEARRIESLQTQSIGPDAADAILTRAYRSKILTPRTFGEALAQWDAPKYEWGTKGTAWHLYNAITHALKPVQVSNPRVFSRATMKVMGLIGSACVGFDSSDLILGDADAPVGSLDNPIEIGNDGAEYAGA